MNGSRFLFENCLRLRDRSQCVIKKRRNCRYHFSYIIPIAMGIMSFYSTNAFMIEMTQPTVINPKLHSLAQRQWSGITNSRKATMLSMSEDNSKDIDLSSSDDEDIQMEEVSENEEKKKQNTKSDDDSHEQNKMLIAQNEVLLKRITQLEAIAGSQAVEIRKLREESKSMKEAVEAFAQVVDLLRQAGLSIDQSSQSVSSKDGMSLPIDESTAKQKNIADQIKDFEYMDHAEIFGIAPASVTDAADAAGASILAALLGGKQRMLVDVRDAELSRDPDVLVQFIELAILPVAAGLEGLKTQKNRVKIVFPTVSQLMQYRKSMCLAAPEVVSLSTLGFDPVERRDNLVVIVAPAPDDEEGLLQMNELLSSGSLKQPVVVLNHHMVPLGGPAGAFEPIYHLRLLTVQYMAGETMSNNMEKNKSQVTDLERVEANQTLSSSKSIQGDVGNSTETRISSEKEDAALAAAMEHAHELGVHQGVTRAMVIRAYPRPWHVFVDTSPDTDADFEVAATFDEYPSQDDINYAIVECLEGSEREDELVAQQMQQAIESGQLNSISNMLGMTDIQKNVGSEDEDNEDDDDDFYNDWDPWFGADTV